MTNNNLITFITAIFFTMGLVACGDFQKAIEVPLPAHTSRLVAECYLEEGQPYQFLLTESTSYFAGVTLPNVPNALVTISHNQKTDTLSYSPANLDTLQKFYNYRSPRIAKFDTEKEYQLYAKDKQGREIKAKTKFKPVVKIDSIDWKFEDKDIKNKKAYLLVRFKDKPQEENFYRLTVHKSKITSRPITNFTFSDRFFGADGAVLTGYSFAEKDTLFVTLYHIDKEYFQFLDTSRDAARANGNPFALPSGVISNIQGGTGIFTAVSADRKQIIITKK
jgi:hypothetical protein